MNSVRIESDDIYIRVGVYLFKEDNSYIAYCPSLDLSGYDASKDKAKDSFEHVLNDWLNEQISKNSLKEDLKAHGWKLTDKGGKEPLIEELPNKKDIKEVLNLPEYIKYSVSARSKIY